MDQHLNHYHGEWTPQLRHILVNASHHHFINQPYDCIIEPTTEFN